MLEATRSEASFDRKSGLRSVLNAAQITARSLGERILEPSPQRRVAILSSATYQAALALLALFLLAVAVWFVVQLLDYRPDGPDNARTLVFINKILREPGAWTLEKQLPLLQFATYASLITLFGWDAPLVLVPLLFSAALALLVGYIAQRVGGGLWTFLVAALMLASLPVFLVQAKSLPFYPPTLFFGYGGVFAAIVYARSGGRMAFVGAALGLPAALYSFGVGIVFLAVLPLYLLIDRRRPVLIRLAQVYAIVLALAAPWLVWHLAVDGYSGLFGQQTTWFIDRGYLNIRNSEFWDTGSSSHIQFLGRLPGMFADASGRLAIPLVALSVVGLIRLPSWSWRAAVLLALAIPIGALVYVTPAAHARYVYVLLPGLVLLSVYGLPGLLHLLSSYRRTAHLSAVGAMVAFGLLGTLFLQNVQDDLDTANMMQTRPAQSELAAVAKFIDDDKAVIGSRLYWLIYYEHENELLTTDFISEEDFVTYLSWPSDEAVAEMFERNNVGWLLLHRAERWERDYNVWLMKAAGQLPQHYVKVKDSGLVEEVYTGYSYSLYRVVPTGEAASREPIRGARD
jgi:4-amino-4-deoxy-L-arabinose transferase-like glycosyltransferase